jgi:hypothetical protein
VLRKPVMLTYMQTSFSRSSLITLLILRLIMLTKIPYGQSTISSPHQSSHSRIASIVIRAQAYIECFTHSVSLLDTKVDDPQLRI